MTCLGIRIAKFCPLISRGVCLPSFPLLGRILTPNWLLSQEKHLDKRSHRGFRAWIDLQSRVDVRKRHGASPPALHRSPAGPSRSSRLRAPWTEEGAVRPTAAGALSGGGVTVAGSPGAAAQPTTTTPLVAPGQQCFPPVEHQPKEVQSRYRWLLRRIERIHAANRDYRTRNHISIRTMGPI